jgi:hypothetical protein
MTFTINGIGTILSGDRWLSGEEYHTLAQHKDFQTVIKNLTKDEDLKIETQDDLFRFRIATKSFAVLFIPLIPIETFIYYYPKVKWHENQKYIPLFYTKGKGKVDWDHVKKSWSFYIAPVLVLGIILHILF